MELDFFKYQGTGNDFILIDNREQGFTPDEKTIAFLCDRNFGIGSDGLIILTAQDGYDFRMSYYNSDGKESSMCGNGGRCIAAYAHSLGLSGTSAKFYANDGEHIAEILSGINNVTRVRLKMKEVSNIFHTEGNLFLDTGSPHLVTFVHDIRKHDVYGHGRNIRYSDEFTIPGTNVDFVEVFPDHLFVRTYERGVENETLSCGTGVTASALAAALKHQRVSPIRVETPGGELQVSFQQTDEHFTNIWLEGEASFVFSGSIML